MLAHARRPCGKRNDADGRNTSSHGADRRFLLSERRRRWPQPGFAPDRRRRGLDDEDSRPMDADGGMNGRQTPRISRSGREETFSSRKASAVSRRRSYHRRRYRFHPQHHRLSSGQRHCHCSCQLRRVRWRSPAPPSERKRTRDPGYPRHVSPEVIIDDRNHDGEKVCFGHPPLISVMVSAIFLHLNFHTWNPPFPACADSSSVCGWRTGPIQLGYRATGRPLLPRSPSRLGSSLFGDARRRRRRRMDHAVFGWRRLFDGRYFSFESPDSSSSPPSGPAFQLPFFPTDAGSESRHFFSPSPSFRPTSRRPSHVASSPSSSPSSSTSSWSTASSTSAKRLFLLTLFLVSTGSTVSVIQRSPYYYSASPSRQLSREFVRTAQAPPPPPALGSLKSSSSASASFSPSSSSAMSSWKRQYQQLSSREGLLSLNLDKKTPSPNTVLLQTKRVNDLLDAALSGATDDQGRR